MSIEALDVIDMLPRELAARLEADEYFADIPVVVAEAGDIEMEMAKKQAVITSKAGKRGAAVIVLQLIGDDEYPNVTFGPMTLRPAFQVLENLALNRDGNGTGKSARQIARRIRDVIKSLGLHGITTEFVPDKPCIEPVDVGAELGKLVRAYQVNFYTFEADSQEVGQVAMPQFAPFTAATPQFQMTCETAEADIWYSLDDSFPAPGRNGSALYAGPIDIPEEGLTVRAAAYKAGLVASQVNRGNITVQFSKP